MVVTVSGTRGFGRARKMLRTHRGRGRRTQEREPVFCTFFSKRTRNFTRNGRLHIGQPVHEQQEAEQQPQKQLVFVDNNRNVHACILMIDYFVLPNKKEFYSPIMHGSRVFSMESINQRFKILANGKEVKRKELILNNIGNERCEIIFQIKFEMNEDILNNNIEVFFSQV